MHYRQERYNDRVTLSANFASAVHVDPIGSDHLYEWFKCEGSMMEFTEGEQVRTIADLAAQSGDKAVCAFSQKSFIVLQSCRRMLHLGREGREAK